MGFTQENLHPEDLALLDAGFEAGVWLGRDVPAAVKSRAVQLAKAHLARVGRRADTPILLVKQGREPRPFTATFAVWESDVATVGRQTLRLR